VLANATENGKHLTGCIADGIMVQADGLGFGQAHQRGVTRGVVRQRSAVLQGLRNRV
jgi:hypothetical protein